MLKVMNQSEGGSMAKTFPWEHSYQDAMLELNPAELPGKVKRAVCELAARSRELLLVQDAASIAEWQAIADALHDLSVIEKHELTSSAEASTPADPPPPTGPRTRDAA
jgi:hypothetical protein